MTQGATASFLEEMKRDWNCGKSTGPHGEVFFSSEEEAVDPQ